MHLDIGRAVHTIRSVAERERESTHWEGGLPICCRGKSGYHTLYKYHVHRQSLEVVSNILSVAWSFLEDPSLDVSNDSKQKACLSPPGRRFLVPLYVLTHPLLLLATECSG